MKNPKSKVEIGDLICDIPTKTYGVIIKKSEESVTIIWSNDGEVNFYYFHEEEVFNAFKVIKSE